MGRIGNFEEFNRMNEDLSTKDANKNVNEKLDGEELLSVKQRKLPEGLKKGIIANLKKKKPVKDDECEDKKGKKCEDDDEKKDKKDVKKSGSDEEKYLTPKQRNLPEGLKKGIIARAKKNK